MFKSGVLHLNQQQPVITGTNVYFRQVLLIQRRKCAVTYSNETVYALLPNKQTDIIGW